MFLRILSITLLLSVGLWATHAQRRGRFPGSASPCCTRAPFVRVNITGSTYQHQTANDLCVDAIIVQIQGGKKACVNPKAKWLLKVIGNMTLETA